MLMCRLLWLLNLCLTEILDNTPLFQDSRVAVKACEGLMLCSSLPEETAASCIIHDTRFCTEMTQRLIEAYLKLPAFISPADLENAEAKWGLVRFNWNLIPLLNISIPKCYIMLNVYFVCWIKPHSLFYVLFKSLDISKFFSVPMYSEYQVLWNH